MSAPIRTPLMTVMVSAVRKAARAIARDIGEVDNLQVSRKGTADFATNADHKAERALYDELKRSRPDFGFLMEETGEVAGKDTTMEWVIDPIDGTSNFIHAVPYFCISLALEKKLPNGGRETLAGIIYDPLRDEMFMAEKGQGAYVNDRRLYVSGRRVPDEALIATSIPRTSRSYYPEASKQMNDLMQSPFSLRAGGATALDLAYIAAGRYDGGWYVVYNRWDVAAGLVLVREAGGLVYERAAKEDAAPLLLVSNPHLHTQLLTELGAKA